MLLSDVCLSVAYIGRNSRTERPGKTKIGTEVAHVTRDSDTTFKVKRSKVKVTSPLWLVVWTYSNGDLSICVHDVYRVTTCRPGRGISWRPPAYSLYLTVFTSSMQVAQIMKLLRITYFTSLQIHQLFRGFSSKCPILQLKSSPVGSMQQLVSQCSIKHFKSITSRHQKAIN